MELKKQLETEDSKYDILIVGQGLCGTFLSYYLMKEGQKVLVIDHTKEGTASKIASGVINPVTGRRIVRTWRIEELLPFALSAYRAFEDELGVSVLNKTSVLDFHPSQQMKEAFDKRLDEEPEYLHKPYQDAWKTFFNYYYGVGEIKPCLLVDLNTMIQGWRQKLIEMNGLISEAFNQEHLSITDHNIIYKNITADKIIFCDGVGGIANPFFKNLPFAPNKGEALIVSIPGLPYGNIYKQGLSIVPWKDGLFWIGSSYEWKFDHDMPTDPFRARVENQLKLWLKLPFDVVDHLAAVRPANIERRPFVGLHPQSERIGIFNGMGTKGCSLAPFFGKQFADRLIKGTPIYPDADVKRFEKILQREMN